MTERSEGIDMSKIKNISVTNYQKLSQVEVSPGTHLFVIGGKNEQGKTTLLDAIASAFGGARALPAVAVRTGENASEVIIELDDGYRVRQRVRVDEGGKQTAATVLTRTDADGVRSEIKSPQAMLSAMAESLAFDPLAFIRLTPMAQREALCKLIKLDTSAIDAEYDAAFARRADVKREVDTMAAKLDGIPHDPSAPTEPVDTAELTAELVKEQGKVDARSEALRRAQNLARSAADFAANCERAKVAAEAASAAFEQAKQNALKAENARAEAQRLADAMPTGDVETVTKRLAGAGELNARHATAKKRSDLERQLLSLRDEGRSLNNRVTAARQSKADAIASANYPIDGLSIDDTGILYQGLPLAQSSQARKIRIGLAIVAKTASRLRCALIREGSALDDDAIEAIVQWAEKEDMQVLLERVGRGDECNIIIHDGRVSEVRS